MARALLISTSKPYSFPEDAPLNFAFRKQQTLKNPVSISGFGYWSSLDVQVEFRPAPVDSGIVFVRRDVAETVRIRANLANRAEAPRRTSLQSRGCSVDMVEHIMAALSGLNIDNCEVWVNRAEMPGCDGSSQPFVEALLRAGIQTQSQQRPRLVVEKPIRVGTSENWIHATPNQAGHFQLSFALDYPLHPVIGSQKLDMIIDSNSFQKQLAPARTFILKHEAEYLNRQGLGKRATFKDLLVFDENGPIQNSLRFDNECARHKALDVIGDFALAPFDIVGTFTAFRSGHKLNAEMVESLLSDAKIVRPETISESLRLKKSA